jgi:hypothetical protein
MTIADFFCGVVSINKFSQIVNLEMIPYGIAIDGEFQLHGYKRTLYVGNYTEKRFYFEGIPASLAENLPDDVTVTDITGKTYKVSFNPSVSDGSSGTAIFENYNNSVAITKMSPRLRCIEVVERTGDLSASTSTT